MKRSNQKKMKTIEKPNSALKWNSPAMIVLSILSLVELGIWIYKICQ